MKLKSIFLPLLTGGALILPSWADRATQPTQVEDEEAPAKLAENGAATTPALAADLDLNVMAKKLGFAAHLPKNTEGYFSFMGADDIFQRIAKSEFGKSLIEVLANSGQSLEELETEEEFIMLKGLIGEEIFVAFGDGSGQQGAHFAELSKSSNFHQMKEMVKMFAGLASGEIDSDEEDESAMETIAGIIGDPKDGLAAFEKLELPPITIGFKVSDGDQREQFAEMLNGLFMMLINPALPLEEIDLRKGEIQLGGITLVGKKLAAMAAENSREEMIEAFGSEAYADRFLKAVEAKNVHFATGMKGDYFFVYLGGSLDGFQIIEKSEDSLLAHPELDFLKNYTEKDLRLLIFSEEEGLKQASENGEAIASMARGISSGLSETDIFGDTRDIQTLLEHAASVESSLYKMLAYKRSGIVGFLEEGFRIESHGGSNLPLTDTETPHAFASLSQMEDLLYFSNSRTNPQFTSELFEMLDSLGQAAYLIGERVSGMEIDDDFSQSFGMFDQIAASELREIWEALSGEWAEGTGDEGALIVDTRGTLPAVEKFPKSLLQKGRIPRIAYITPVTDRAKLGQAWARMEKPLAKLLASAEKMNGPKIQMQEVLETTKGGFTYYHTEIPYTTEDARPLVGLNEQHFYLSTSQNLIAAMSEKLAAAQPEEAKKTLLRKGAYSRLDFKALHGLAEHWLTLLKENSEEIFPGEDEREDFKEKLPEMEKALAAFRKIEEMTLYTRKEAGEARSSFHFKVN